MEICRRAVVSNSVLSIVFRGGYEPNCRLTAIVFVPDSTLRIIGDYAFRNSELVSVEIPASVCNLGYGSFYGCNKLKNVTFVSGSHLKEIGNSAFYRCCALPFIMVPADVHKISDFASDVWNIFGISSQFEFDAILFQKARYKLPQG